MLQALVSLLFAVVPVLLYLWAVWEMDRYDREPLGLLALNFLWGALGAIMFSVVFGLMLREALSVSAFGETVIYAPVIEEITKGAFLLWTSRSRHFDNITDGIVYGMAIGLGFGMTENFLYFWRATSTDEWVTRVVVRTLYTAVMHAMATGILGASVGVTKFQVVRWRWGMRVFGLLVAMTMHGLWNYYSIKIDAGASDALGSVLILGSLFVIIVLVQISLFYENRLIIMELTEESRDGLFPAVHIDYVAHSSKRKMIGWLPPSIDRKQYCQLATRLAFRKSQYKRCDASLKETYLTEIEQVRREIRDILDAESNSDAAQLY
jgi:protease PrsW